MSDAVQRAVLGVQLWLDLPRVHKTDPPCDQDLPATRIPLVEPTGACVRVIAGEHAGVRGPARSFTPVKLLHVLLLAGIMGVLEEAA